MKAYIALGSNIAPKQKHLETAMKFIDRIGQTRILFRSRMYENPPLDLPPGSPTFLNGMVEIETECSAQELLRCLLDIETSMGRVRASAGHYESRVIDLDIILFGDEIIQEETLRAPHPEMMKRWFVLKPLCDLCPEKAIPGEGKTARQALDYVETHFPRQIGEEA